MGASLSFTLIKVAVLSWLALTIYVIWCKTGAYYPGLQHRYFWRWVIGGIFTEVPLLDRLGGYLKLPIEGGWYPLPEVTAWLNSREVYHASFGFWFWHFCRYTALLPLGIGALLIAIRIRLDADAEHVRGLKLLHPGRHNRQLNGGWLARVRRALDRTIFVRQASHHSGIKLGTSVIPENKEWSIFSLPALPAPASRPSFDTCLRKSRDADRARL